MKWILLSFVVLVVLVQPASAATFNVDSTADLPDANPGNGICATAGGQCTLRAAVVESSWNFATHDIINLPAGYYDLTIAGANENFGDTGDLDVGEVDIIGANDGISRTIIDANHLDRVFEIFYPTNISNLDITFGTASVGGGILNHSTLDLDYVSVTESHATSSGGGIRSDGNLNLTGCVVYNNTTDGYAAGISIYQGLATIFNSTISQNQAKLDSGGLDVDGDGYAHLEFSTLSENVADWDENGSGNGGGVYAFNGQINVLSSIIAENEDKGGQAPDCFGSLTSEGYNLIHQLGGCSIGGDATGNIYNQDPQMSRLTVTEGGKTYYHRLYATSPARDAVSYCTELDQRGVSRPFGSTCDIGAFEFNDPYQWFDDFQDGSAADWTPTSGTWRVVAGELKGKTSTSTTNVAPFAGCGVDCKFEAVIRIGTANARASLLAFYQDNSNLVEVTLLEDRDRVQIKQLVDGVVLLNESRSMPVHVGVDYHVVVQELEGEIQVSIDGWDFFYVPPAAPLSGGVGFRVRSTTGRTATAFFEEIFVY